MRKHPQFLIELIETLGRKKVLTGQTSISLGALGVFIKNGEIIAADAGVDLSLHLNHGAEGKCIEDITLLFDLCQLIDTAHKAGFYFRDLKLNNILYKEFIIKSDGTRVRLPTPKLTLIDLDELCRIHQLESESANVRVVGEPILWCGTYAYMTLGLLEKKISGEPIWLLTADTYSACLLMLCALDPQINAMPKAPCEFKDGTRYSKPKDAKKEYEVGKEKQRFSIKLCKIFEYGIYHETSVSEQRRKQIKSVIEKYVKPRYQVVLLKFMADPIAFPLKTSLTLTDIFNWQAGK